MNVVDRQSPLSLPEQVYGRNRLIETAGTLFSLVGQLRGTTSHPDVDTLRLQVEQEVKAFEVAARAAGADIEEVSTARYVLCTLIDETVLGTPWGNESIWNEQTLLAKFYREAWGGEKFFNILNHLEQEPARYIDLLELLYLCLLMGFEGKYKVQEQGSSKLQTIQENLFYIIRDNRGEIERELSPHWRGVEDRRNPLVRYVPLWVLGAVLGLLLVAIFIGFRLSLNNAAEPVFQQLNTMGRNSLQIAPVSYAREPEAVMSPRLATLLASDLNAGLITIDDQLDRSRLVMKGDGLFRSGSVTIEDRHYALLERIGQALLQVPGPVLVVGHTDNVPMRSLRFSSNWDLSRQRAASVTELLASITDSSGRFQAEGRADTEPLVPNDSAANRARNRRVEIIVFKEAGNI
jgi:type VI secretion system protein ImpK